MVEKPRILIYDCETLPNLGYFWDTFSDRSLPLEFVVKPKSILTIAYKWYGEGCTKVLTVKTPYDDTDVLKDFLKVWEQATHVVAHYSRFDKPFIAARLMANGLPPLPPVVDICTYKLAKLHFGRSLNGNKLDNLGTILNVGNKIKTSASLWVRCALGNRTALREMAAYNKQDVNLLEAVFTKMLPYVETKINWNIFNELDEDICPSCGSVHIIKRGFSFTKFSKRQRYVCGRCRTWFTMRIKKNVTT